MNNKKISEILIGSSIFRNVKIKSECIVDGEVEFIPWAATHQYLRSESFGWCIGRNIPRCSATGIDQIRRVLILHLSVVNHLILLS